VFCVAVIAVAGVLIYRLLPGVQVARQLKEANAYIETEAYDDAIASCQEALKIDSSSVQAYRSMAGAYLTKEDTMAAEQILYQGWETTQDESLLQYYCTVLLNEAVDDINSQNCTLDTLGKCVSVLERMQLIRMYIRFWMPAMTDFSEKTVSRRSYSVMEPKVIPAVMKNIRI